MALLRGLLKVQAAVWIVSSLAVGLFPRLVLEELFSQTALREYAWVRASAVMGMVLALIMVLVARRIEELWWWSWAFVALELGTATVFALNALLSLPPGASAWPWWLLASVNATFGALLLLGIGRAGQEKPFA